MGHCAIAAKREPDRSTVRIAFWCCALFVQVLFSRLQNTFNDVWAACPGNPGVQALPAAGSQHQELALHTADLTACKIRLFKGNPCLLIVNRHYHMLTVMAYRECCITFRQEVSCRCFDLAQVVSLVCLQDDVPFLPCAGHGKLPIAVRVGDLHHDSLCAIGCLVDHLVGAARDHQLVHHALLCLVALHQPDERVIPVFLTWRLYRRVSIVLFVRDPWVLIRATLSAILFLSLYIVSPHGIQIAVAVIHCHKGKAFRRIFAYCRCKSDYCSLAWREPDPCGIRADSHAALRNILCGLDLDDLKPFKVIPYRRGIFVRNKHL